LIARLGIGDPGDGVATRRRRHLHQSLGRKGRAARCAGASHGRARHARGKGCDSPTLGKQEAQSSQRGRIHHEAPTRAVSRR
jgi:hypothetical protein